MKCAIMQPTYLPWVGYFDLIESVDTFVFLDDVQFAKRTWQQRNRIMLNGQEKMISVPVLTKGRRDQTILETLVDDSQSWRTTHLETLKHAYKKHSSGEEVIYLVQEMLQQPESRLAALNMNLIVEISTRMGFRTTFIRSSEIAVGGKKSEYLLNLCMAIGARVYLSAAGSRAYIEEEGLFSSNKDINIEFHNYSVKKYPQKGFDGFMPYLSIIDLVANVGIEEAVQYI